MQPAILEAGAWRWDGAELMKNDNGDGASSADKICEYSTRHIHYLGTYLQARYWNCAMVVVMMLIDCAVGEWGQENDTFWCGASFDIKSTNVRAPLTV